MISREIISVEDVHKLSIPELLHSFDNRLALLEMTENNPRVGYLSDYTNLYDATNGWSKAFQQMVDDGYTRLIINDGIDHVMTQQGTDSTGRPYCILLNGLSDIIIECQNGSTFSTDYTGATVPNIFSCVSCENIIFKNCAFIGNGTRDYTTTRYALYTGCGVFAYGCQNVLIDHCQADSLGYLVCLMETDRSTIQDCFFKHKYYASGWGDERLDKPYSAIILYSCKDVMVQNNVIYGGCCDGDLSIFGGRTERCHVINNKLYSYGYDDTSKTVYFSNQGITYDQGPRNCIIAQNILHGYYYGIDMKADTHNCLCTVNILENCKISIADRQGEAERNGKTQFNKIINNKIILGHNVVGETLEHDFGTIGILIEDRQGCVVQNNDLNCSFYIRSSLGKTCGIYVSGRQSEEHNSLYPLVVQNNQIIFCMFNNSTMFNTNEYSTCIYVVNARMIHVSNNVMKCYNDASYYPIRLGGTVTSGFIMHNLFFGKSTTATLQYDTGSTVSQIESNLI